MLGAGVWILNLLLFMILQKTRRIGTKRSAGISGWISMLFALLILILNNVSPFSSFSSPFVIILALISIFSILFIYMPALSPHINLGSFGDISRLSIQIGTYIGIIAGFLVAILAN